MKERKIQSKLEFELLNLEKQASTNNSSWLMTFADLLSLIITFFVLIYSMQVVKNNEWDQIRTSLSKTLNPEKSVESKKPPPTELKSITKIVTPHGKDLDYLKVVLEEEIRKYPALKRMFDIQSDNDGLTISFASDELFASGDVRITARGGKIFDVVVNVLQSLPNAIEIIGYAYDLPLDVKKYPTGRELGLTRAMILSKILRNRGYNYNIVSYGKLPYPKHLGSSVTGNKIEKKQQ